MSLRQEGHPVPSMAKHGEPDRDDSADEMFEDAEEAITTSAIITTTSSVDEVPTLEESLHQVTRLLAMALDNKFKEARSICDKWAHISMYHALGRATLSFLKGVLTLEKAEIDEAMDSLNHLIHVYQSKKKQTGILSKMMWRPNYNTYTEEEAHAEVIYAEALLMVSLMTFLGDQNLVNLVKGAFRIRSCFQTYKECLCIMDQRTTWESDFSRKHFESGVRMGIGTFNLMISHMPGKILRVLEVLGFSGNRNTGFTELESSATMTEGLRAPLALLISMTYHCYVEHYFGTGAGDVEYVKVLLEIALRDHPNSAFFLLFGGRVSQLEGNIDVALDRFNKCITIQDEWKQLHNICYWESLWCHSLRCEWKEASHYANLLRIKCNWSPATYTYQYATCLYQMYEDMDPVTDADRRADLKQEIDTMIDSVPGLRIRYAGKTIPCEKFAIVKAEKYRDIDPNGSLFLPALEFLYIWNMFPLMKNSGLDAVRIILTKVTRQMDMIKKGGFRVEGDGEGIVTGSDLKDPMVDRWCLCLILKGICLRLLGSPLEAEQNFLQVIKLEKKLVADTFLPPHAAMEVGLTYMSNGDLVLARHWLEKSRKDYSGYLYETIIHFRVHCALRSIKSRELDQQIEGSSVSSSSVGSIEEVVPMSTESKSSFCEMARVYQEKQGPDKLLGL